MYQRGNAILTRGAVIDDDVAAGLLGRICVFLSHIVSELLVQRGHKHLVELHLRSGGKALQLVHILRKTVILHIIPIKRFHIHSVQMIEYFLSSLRLVERNQLLVQDGILSKQRLHRLLRLSS